jgi:hypothetical protein
MSDAPKKPTIRLADMQSPRKIRTPAQRKRAREQAFKPYATAIGWISYEWNRLQEALGEIFSDIVEPVSKAVGYAMWHSTDNERTLRNMLQAAVKAANIEAKIKPRAFADISWLILEVNKKLAGRRNSAIHAPLVMLNSTSADDPVEIIPMYFFGHPRAMELKDKSLLDEFKWYRDHLEKLADFGENLHFAMIFSDFSWPDRPQLPPRGEYQSRKAPRRKKKTK